MANLTKRLFATSLLAAVGTLAFAQTPPAAAQGTRPDLQQRQQRGAEHRAQRLADLKAELKITSAQEGAWNAYTESMPRPGPGNRAQREDWKNLTTPERIDRHQQHMAEREARMKQHGDATKAFYAQLSPEQQATFDQRAMHRGGPGKHRGPRRGHGHS